MAFGNYLSFNVRVRVTHRKATFGWLPVPGNIDNEAVIEVKAKDSVHAREVAEKELKKRGDRGEALKVWMRGQEEPEDRVKPEPVKAEAHHA